MKRAETIKRIVDKKGLSVERLSYLVGAAENLLQRNLATNRVCELPNSHLADLVIQEMRDLRAVDAGWLQRIFNAVWYISSDRKAREVLIEIFKILRS